MIYFKIKHKIFFGAFVFWFSFVSLVAPMKSLAATTIYSNQNASGGYDETTIVNNPANQSQNATGFMTDETDAEFNADGTQIPRALPADVNNPAKASVSGAAYTSNTPAGGVGDLALQAASSIGTCSVGAILGRLLSSLISNAINGLVSTVSQSIISPIVNKVTGAVTGAASGAVSGALGGGIIGGIGGNIAGSLIGGVLGGGAGYRANEVPVYEKDVTQNTRLVANKEVGGGWGPPTGLIPWQDAGKVSHDSIMFCIVNEIISYITQSTIKWINSGFNGNPVFVQNPGALLQTVADQEANTFITSLTRGMNRNPAMGANGMAVPNADGTISLYQPVAQSVVRNLISGYSSTYAQQAAQRPIYLPQDKANYDAYMNGARWYGMNALAEIGNPKFNVYGATNLASEAMGTQVGGAQQNVDKKLTYSDGILVPTDCVDGYKRFDGTCASNGILDTSSGRLVGYTLQNRDMMPYLRTAMAKDFDSIVTALVNQLIKIAVTEISKKTGINPQTIYSTGLGISNQIQNSAINNAAIKADPANPGNGLRGFDTVNGVQKAWVMDASGNKVYQ